MEESKVSFVDNAFLITQIGPPGPSLLILPLPANNKLFYTFNVAGWEEQLVNISLADWAIFFLEVSVGNRAFFSIVLSGRT